MNFAAAVVTAALVITTQNVRVGLPPDQAHHDIDRAAVHSSILFTQEMALRSAPRFAPRGWGVSHFAGLRRGDCATYWDRSTWHKVRAYPVPLTYAPFRAGHRFFLVTILRGKGTTVAAVCVHSITKSRRASRIPVFRRGMHRLDVVLQRLREHTPYVVVGGDWNRPYPRRAHFKGFRSVEPHRATGSHGGRIDYVYWSRPHLVGRAVHVIGHTYSDHNGVRLHLRLH